MSRKIRTAGGVEEIDNEAPSKGNLIVKILVILFVLALIALSASLLSHRRMSKKVTRLSTVSGQKEIAKKETDALVKKVSKLIALPTGETPTIATVNDANGLAKGQSFYKGSKNGDKVLIYFKAQKAFIYSPDRNFLVNVGPIYVDKSARAAATTKTQTQSKLNIEIRNGTSQTGLATQTSDKLKKIANFNVVYISDAATSTYKKNIIVDLSKGTKKELVKSLEKELGLTSVTTLPAKEKTTTADVLVIVAK